MLRLTCLIVPPRNVMYSQIRKKLARHRVAVYFFVEFALTWRFWFRPRTRRRFLR